MDMRFSPMSKAIVLVLSVLFATAAAGQQYKWIDKDGKVRYGDVPPPGVEVQRLKPPPPGTPPPAGAAKKDGAKGLTPEQAFRKRQEDAEKDQQKQAAAEQEAKAKQENCAQAQSTLRTLESGQRISRTDAKGERVFLEEAEIAKETAKARDAVKQWCG
jgi:hypothetical protein